MIHIEQRVKEALSPIVPIVEPNVYRGSAKEYIVFNYSTFGSTFAEGRPTATIYLLQVHHYLPTNGNPYTARQSIIDALQSIGCTWASIADATDAEGQHWVFECQYKEGVI